MTVKLPNAKPVEMETWANQGEPTAEASFRRSIVTVHLGAPREKLQMGVENLRLDFAAMQRGRMTKSRTTSHVLVYQSARHQELRQNEIIDRLKAFSLIPDPGTVIEVSAGEGRPLVITYSADSLSYGGIHDLPVLASITISWTILRDLPLSYCSSFVSIFSMHEKSRNTTPLQVISNPPHRL